MLNKNKPPVTPKHTERVGRAIAVYEEFLGNKKMLEEYLASFTDAERVAYEQAIAKRKVE